MFNSKVFTASAILIINLTINPILAADVVSLSPEQRATFDSHIQALLSGHCFQCHGSERQKAAFGLTPST